MWNERAIAALAAKQWGVVSVAQLLAAGLSRTSVARRVRAGRLHRVHRGVYAVGHRRLSRHGAWTAAVLACGPGAALSHASAAALWGLRPRSGTRVHVTVPVSGGRRRRPRIVVHRSPGVETTVHEGIPVTTPARTLRDIRRSLSARSFDRALEQAEILRLDVEDLRHGGTQPSRNDFEEHFLSLVESFGLPLPLVNTVVEGFEVDFAWPDHGLIVETDGWETHGTRTAFERDRRRDATLASAGLRVLRFSWRQTYDDPSSLDAALTGAGLPATRPAPRPRSRPAPAARARRRSR